VLVLGVDLLAGDGVGEGVPLDRHFGRAFGYSEGYGGEVVRGRKEWREDALINTNQGSKGPYNLRRSNASVLVCLVVPLRCNWCLFGVGKTAAVCMTIE
jgi:hypothetical protein